MEKIALVAADRFLHLLHLAVMFFCVTGWIFPETRPANLVLIILIAISWFGLGKFHGYGYCLITGIQWKIKARLGSGRGPPRLSNTSSIKSPAGISIRSR